MLPAACSLLLLPATCRWTAPRPRPLRGHSIGAAPTPSGVQRVVCRMASAIDGARGNYLGTQPHDGLSHEAGETPPSNNSPGAQANIADVCRAISEHLPPGNVPQTICTTLATQFGVSGGAKAVTQMFADGAPKRSKQVDAATNAMNVVLPNGQAPAQWTLPEVAPFAIAGVMTEGMAYDLLCAASPTMRRHRPANLNGTTAASACKQPLIFLETWSISRNKLRNQFADHWKLRGYRSISPSTTTPLICKRRGNITVNGSRGGESWRYSQFNLTHPDGRRCLCLVFPLTSWLRHCLCLAFPLPSWLRHCLCLVFPLPSWLRHCLCLVFFHYLHG